MAIGNEQVMNDMNERPPNTPVKSPHARGFTLIEMMIVVALIGILSAIAFPSYRAYILRGQLTDATNALATFRGNMERYYQDNRTYAAVGTTIVPPCATTDATTRTVGSFVITCSGTDLAASSFKLSATGSGATAGFTYTVTQRDERATPAVPASSGFSTSTTCWVLKKGQTC